MAETVRVFISSTWLDLQPEREALERALLRMRTTSFASMAYFGSLPDTPRDVSLAEVERSDVYVGIFAHRYGSGITEAEYRRAVERELPVLIYLKDEAVAIHRDHIERTRAAQRKLEALKRELKDRHVVSVFTAPDHLAMLVVADLHNLLGAPAQDVLNPFTWRGGITRAEAFFDREDEQRRLRAYLLNHQSCQIFGPRRMGKTSLHRQVQRKVREWHSGAVAAYLDLQDPRCHTLTGWLERAGHEFGWSPPPTSLADFAERVEDMIMEGRHPVLCLEEFEALAIRSDEFGRDFLAALRACAQAGLSVITSSGIPLSRLTDPGDPTSPFYNTLAPLELGPFSAADAGDFVTLARPGVSPFTPEEREAILTFARGHPLALQVACSQMLEARRSRARPPAAIEAAAAEMMAYLPFW